jgi:hypothetical protein
MDNFVSPVIFEFIFTSRVAAETSQFIRANADPIWLHQNEMWELMEPEPHGPSDRDD